MGDQVVTRQPVSTEIELEQLGFTREQIASLVALRDRYPLVEFVTNRTACERLIFLRWCYRTGRID
jgi:hypothetical protein